MPLTVYFKFIHVLIVVSIIVGVYRISHEKLRPPKAVWIGMLAIFVTAVISIIAYWKQLIFPAHSSHFHNHFPQFSIQNAVHTYCSFPYIPHTGYTPGLPPLAHPIYNVIHMHYIRYIFPGPPSFLPWQHYETMHKTLQADIENGKNF